MRGDQTGPNFSKTVPSFDSTRVLRQPGEQTGSLLFDKTQAIVFCMHAFKTQKNRYALDTWR